MLLKYSSVFVICASLVAFAACVQKDSSKPATPPAVPLAASQADGGWIGSGGELFEDAHNPWFLTANTDVIRYCIQLDNKSVSTDADTLARVFESSFQYWMKEFKRIEPYFVQKGYVTMGGHQIQRVACDGQEDITLLAGLSQLNEQQKEFLKKPRNFLSIAVRTHYDVKKLRGKGFIFLASDLGADSYINHQGRKLDQTWSQEGLLFRVLTHELGHVFGIPHSDRDSGWLVRWSTKGPTEWKDALMSADYPEKVVSSPRIYSEVSALPSTLGHTENYETCFIPENTKALLGLEKDQNCLRVVLEPNSKKGDAHYRFEVFAYSENQNSEAKLIAKASPESLKGFESSFLMPLISVRITEEQELLEFPQYQQRSIMGPGMVSIELHADLNIIGANSGPVKALIRAEPNRIVVTIVDAQGQLQTLIN